eukprot:319324-Karenia_brevis.AAC.1
MPMPDGKVSAAATANVSSYNAAISRALEKNVPASPSANHKAEVASECNCESALCKTQRCRNKAAESYLKLKAARKAEGKCEECGDKPLFGRCHACGKDASARAVHDPNDLFCICAACVAERKPRCTGCQSFGCRLDDACHLPL